MVLLNPVYGLVVPFLCIFTIPLAIFAGLTTTLAFSVLMFRVAVTYLDIVLSLIPQYITGRSSFRTIASTSTSSSLWQYRYRREESKLLVSEHFSTGSGYNSPIRSSEDAFCSTRPGTFYGLVDMSGGEHRSRHRSLGSISGSGASSSNVLVFPSNYGRLSRRSSQVSIGSMGTISPIREGEMSALAKTMIPSSSNRAAGICYRDFEGIGGWRLGSRGEKDHEDWCKINARLELPTHGDARTGSVVGLHHPKTASGGGAGAAIATAESYLMMKGRGG